MRSAIETRVIRSRTAIEMREIRPQMRGTLHVNQRQTAGKPEASLHADCTQTSRSPIILAQTSYTFFHCAHTPASTLSNIDTTTANSFLVWQSSSWNHASISEVRGQHELHHSLEAISLFRSMQHCDCELLWLDYHRWTFTLAMSSVASPWKYLLKSG